MGTPTAAEHVGLSPRIRDLERKVRELAGATANKVAVLRRDGVASSVEIGPDGVRLVSPLTTSGGANLNVDPATGLLARVTSSMRYKREVADLVVDVDKVLDLRPRTFRRRDEVAARGASAPRYVGFIAEEADQLGLTGWVRYDKNGPESFAYDMWAVALQGVARTHRGLIKTLGDRLKRATLTAAERDAMTAAQTAAAAWVAAHPADTTSNGLVVDTLGLLGVQLRLARASNDMARQVVWLTNQMAQLEAIILAHDPREV